MILAAGKGTRLGKITEEIPKVLVDIKGKSVLRLAVEKCTSAGFGDIIINVHHHADKVEKEVQNLNKEGFRISVSDERSGLLETGGGLYKAKRFFGSDPFLLYNADIITDLDLKGMYRFHLQQKGIATLAVRSRPGKRFFLIDGSGVLKGWCNKATGETILAGSKGEELREIAFSGIHIIEPEIFNYMTGGAFTMVKLYLQIAGNHKIYTYRSDNGYWFDIGTPEQLQNARDHFSS